MSYVLEQRRQRTPQYNRVRRNGRAPSGVCVIHTAEGNGAANVLSWILSRPDYGSYHRLIDAGSTLKLAPWNAETFHCRFTNPHSVGISAAVFAKDWKRLYSRGNTPSDAPSSDGSKIIDRMAIEAADFVRFMAGRGVTVPVKRITRAQALNGTPGFLAHGDTDPGRRTDPGKDFDWDYFFRRINHHLGTPSASAPAPGPDLSSKNYYTGVIDGSPGPWTHSAMQRFLSDRGFYDRVIDGDPGRYTWTALQEFLRYLGYFGPPPSGVQDMTTARALQEWLTNTGHYDGPISSTWTDDTWRAWQTYLSYAHKGTKVYPKPSPPKPEPAPKTDTKEGFLMTLTDKQQKKLADDVNKTKMAVGRSEIRERAMVEYLQAIAEAVTDPDSRLRSDVNKTKMAVGRMEAAWQEEQARLEAETEAEQGEQTETEEENHHA